MYKDDIKLFAENEKELKTLIHAVRIYNQDFGMEFGTEKCAILVMKSDKRHLIDGMVRPNQDKMSKLGEKETYILEIDAIKQVELKEKLGNRIISDVFLWIPVNGRAKAGRPARTYIQ